MSADRGDGHSHGGHSHGGHSHGGHSHGQSSSRPSLAFGAGRGQVLFLDTFSGIAGDMTIAALVDLGVPREVILGAAAELGLEGVTLEFQPVMVGALGAMHFEVKISGPQPERSYAEIRKIIEESRLESGTKNLAQRIFRKLAEAEAEVHRSPVDEVHFHEVGAVDAIVDIVGAAAAFTHLGAEVVSAPLPLGRGFVDCRHGVLPLPAPATVLCLRGVPTEDARIDAELVTPTGAAIVATVAQRFARWPSFGPRAVGWGAGTRELADRPNALRVVLGREEMEGQEQASSAPSTHALLEANLDDATGELLAHVVVMLLEEGALDAWAVPCVMKKGRPGLVLSALVRAEDAGRLSETILRESPTLGVRQALVSRVELPRSTVELETPWGPVAVKVSGLPPRRAKPEFDACLSLARASKVPLMEVLSAATRAAEEWLAATRK